MPWHHPSAIVDAGALIGAGTKIWHFSHICGSDVEIGEDCSIGQNCYVGNQVRIGKGCKIQNNVSVYDRVTLGKFVFCGPSMVFTNVINPRAHIPRKNEFRPTVVGNGATLGANCTIVCGTEIGRFAFVAAGAVVNKTLPAFSLVAGVPAKQIGWICHCGIKLKTPLGVTGSNTEQCLSCHSEFKISASVCEPLRLLGCFEEK